MPFRRAARSAATRAQQRRGTPADWLVVGLGNPTSQYAGTRHNVGADAVRTLAQRWAVELRRERKLKAEHVTATRRLSGPDAPSVRVDLAVPETFMNHSGQAVRPLYVRAGLASPANLVVVHDELDLPPGVVRVKAGGGLAGHNGLKSIRQHLGSVDFTRVRIGIGKPPNPEAGASFVLNRPDRESNELLEGAVLAAADAIEMIATSGVEAAMAATNQR